VPTSEEYCVTCEKLSASSCGYQAASRDLSAIMAIIFQKDLNLDDKLGH
jgi:hypothetical protein